MAAGYWRPVTWVVWALVRQRCHWVDNVFDLLVRIWGLCFQNYYLLHMKYTLELYYDDFQLLWDPQMLDQKIAVCYISVYLTLPSICLQMCQIYLFKVYFQSNNQNFNGIGINSWEIKNFNIMKPHLFYLLFFPFFLLPFFPACFRVTAPNLIDYLSGKPNSTFNWSWFYLI